MSPKEDMFLSRNNRKNRVGFYQGSSIVIFGTVFIVANTWQLPLTLTLLNLIF